jgi:hypothetical protein
LALVVIASGVFATSTTWLDRLGAYTGAGTLGYYALPLVGIAGGAGALLTRSRSARAASLVAGATAIVGWYVLLMTQTDVNDAWL